MVRKAKNASKLKKIKKFFKKNYLIVLGIFLIFVFGLWRYHNLRILSFSYQPAVNQVESIGFTPKHIKAYPVGVDVDILQAVIVDGIWPVFPNSAGFVTNGNNLIVYGHNKDQIMGPIRYIKNDAVVTLTDSSGGEHEYKVEKTDTVDPDNLMYLQKTDDETLTIYTCTGFWDTKRFIVVAKRIK